MSETPRKLCDPSAFTAVSRVVEGRCPNAGSACNCTGACQPISVALDDPRSDDEIRAHRIASAAGGWHSILRGPLPAPAPLELDAAAHDVGPDCERDDPLWSPLFEEVWHGVTYKPGTRLLLKPDDEVPGGRWYFQVESERFDAITGEPGVGRGGKAYLSPHMCRSELVQVAFGLFKAFEEHECREFFRYHGEQVHGPHFDVLALHEIAAAGRIEVRS